MKTVFLIALAIMFTGCGIELVQVPNPGPRGPISTVTAEDIEIENLVRDENRYRLGQGQTVLSPGLSCTLYTITGGQYLVGAVNPITGAVQVATFLHQDVFNQTNVSYNLGLNVLPTALQQIPAYRNMIRLTCTGQVVVTESRYNSFDLTSDDGSMLYIDDVTVINNDGNHGANLVTGFRYLRQGVHSFKLDFAQSGGGNQALILKLNGELLPARYWYH